MPEKLDLEPIDDSKEPSLDLEPIDETIVSSKKKESSQLPLTTEESLVSSPVSKSETLFTWKPSPEVKINVPKPVRTMTGGEGVSSTKQEKKAPLLTSEETKALEQNVVDIQTQQSEEKLKEQQPELYTKIKEKQDAFNVLPKQKQEEILAKESLDLDKKQLSLENRIKELDKERFKSIYSKDKKIAEEIDLEKQDIDRQLLALKGQKIPSIQEKADAFASTFGSVSDKNKVDFSNWLRELGVKDNQRFKEITYKSEQGALTEQQKYDLFNEYLSDKQKNLENDLDVMESRGAFQKAEEYQKKVFDYSDLEQKTIDLINQYQITDNISILPQISANKAILERKKQEAQSYYNENNLGQVLPYLEKKDSEIASIQQGIVENLSSHPEVAKKQAEVESENAYYDNVKRNGNWLKKAWYTTTEMGKEAWNALSKGTLNTASAFIGLTKGKDKASVYSPVDRFEDVLQEWANNDTQFITPTRRGIIHGIKVGDNLVSKADGILTIYDKDGLPIEVEEGKRKELSSEYERLKSEGTSEETDFDIMRIIPQTAGQVANMYLMMGGARALEAIGMGKNAAMFTSSYLNSVKDYELAGKQAGLDDKEARMYAAGAAAVTSVLELQMKDPDLVSQLQGRLKANINEYLKAGTKDLGKRVASDGWNFLKNVAGQEVEEISQLFGERAVQGLTNEITGDKNFQFDNTKAELIDTVVLTATTTAMAKTPSIKNTISNPKTAEYWRAASNDLNNYKEVLEGLVETKDITPEKADEFYKTAQSVSLSLSSIPSNIDEAKRMQIVPLIEEKKTLEEEMKKVDKVFQDDFKKKIETIDNRIKDIVYSQPIKEQPLKSEAETIVSESQTKTETTEDGKESEKRQEEIISSPIENKGSEEQPVSSVPLQEETKTEEYGKELEKRLPKHLSPEEKQGMLRGGEINAESAIITRSILESSKESKENVGELLPGDRRIAEEKALEDYAKNKNVWFEKDFGVPDASGMEQDVYYNEDGKTVTKINSNDAHDNWDDFFERIAIHNSIFPDTQYTIKGYTNHKGLFSAVLEQPLIKGGAVGFREVKNEMKKLGFEPMFPKSKNFEERYSFIDKEKGIIVKDLHGENVIKGEDGKIHIIDPIIEFTKERKNKIIEDDTENITGVSGEIREGEESEQAESVTKKSEKETKTSGVLQTSEQEVKKEKVYQIADNILKALNVSDEVKEGLKEKGITYIPKSLKDTEKDAKAYIDAFEKSGNIEAAISNVKDLKNDMPNDVRTAILGALSFKFAELNELASTPEEKVYYMDKAADIMAFYSEYAKELGRGINANKLFKNTLLKMPQVQVLAVQKIIDDRNSKKLKGQNKDISYAFKDIKALMESEEMQQAIQEEVSKQIEEKSKKFSPENKKKISDFFDSLKIKSDPNKLYNNPFGVLTPIYNIGIETIKQAIILGANTSVAIKAGIDEINKRLKLLKEKGEISSSDWMQDEFSKTMSDKLKDLDKKIIKKSKIKIKEKTKEDIISKWENKLSKLNLEEKKKLLGDSIEEIEKTGLLSEERFKQLYAKALGLEYLSDEMRGHILQLQGTINEVEKKLETFLSNPNTKTAEDFKKAQYSARIANEKLSKYFAKEKTIGSLLSTFIQGNLLSPMSLVGNVGGNASLMPFRFTRDLVATGLDSLVGKIAKYDSIKKLGISDKRTIDVLAKQKGYSKGQLEGWAEGFRQLQTGMLPEDIKERSTSLPLHPGEAFLRFYDGLTSKEKKSLEKHVVDALEGTLGIAPEAMFRLLNLGDKGFRRGAENARLYEMASLAGLKGDELTKFLVAPPAEVLQEMKEAGEEATFQQDNIVTEKIAKLRQWTDKEPDFENMSDAQIKASNIIKKSIKTLINLFFTTQAPYIKTPINILTEAFRYALPEVTLAMAVNSAVNNQRRRALQQIGEAMVGLSIRYVVLQLIESGALTPPPPEGFEKEKERQVERLYSKYSGLNISAINRWYNGGDASPEPGDQWIDYTRLGIVGSIMGLQAKIHEENKNKEGYISMATKTAPAFLSSALDQSFLQGTNTMLNAIQEGGWQLDKWLVNTASTLSNVAVPNTIKAIGNAEDEYLRNRKSETYEFSDKLKNELKIKVGIHGHLPTKVNMWGDKVKSAPEGNNAYTWYLLDFVKSEKKPKSMFGYDIYQLYKKTKNKDVFPSIPDDILTIKNKEYVLSPSQYEDFAIKLGKARKSEIEPYLSGLSQTYGDYKKQTDEKRIDHLKDIYEKTFKMVKREFIKQNLPLLKEVSEKK